MKLFLFVILFSLNLHARTDGQFLGMQYTINIMSSGVDGFFDHTPAKIFEQMSVPEQNSFVGPGKALVTSQKDFTFICHKKAENNYHCSIIVFNSSFGKIGLRSAYLKYTGTKALEMYSQFHPNADGTEINITDDTAQFNLIVRPDLFQLNFLSR